MASRAEKNARSPNLARLSDQNLFRENAYIGGKWAATRSGETITVRDPGDGAYIGCVPKMSAAETVAAVDAANDAFMEWRARLPQDRATHLQAWHDLIIGAREDLAVLMTLEQGKPLAEARGEIDYAASFVAFYAAEALRLNVESVTSHLPDAEMSVRRRPVGVAALVTPWNFPSAMITRKAAAALAAGCTAVVHPSAWTPFSALALAELADRAGIPPGVFNVVTGNAPEVVGTLTADTRVRAVSFTGSTEVGRIIAAQSAETIKRLILELGGHAPLIVFDDADMEKAATIAIGAKFATSGQDCLAANRIFVQRNLHDRFVAAFTRKVQALTVGHGLTQGVDIGPLMHARAVAKVEAQVADAVEKGARILCGGKVLPLGPRFFTPTVLVDVPADALIMREETFGPVAAMVPFETEAEVIERSNDTEYGLAAYLITENRARIDRMVRALDFGMVAVNRVKMTGATVPFGGVKQSGLGREGSRHGMEDFTEIRYVCRDAA